MQTILRILDLAGAAKDREEILEFIEGEFQACVNSGDFLGAGEWCASKPDYCSALAARV
jgi:hypothetical protein